MKRIIVCCDGTWQNGIKQSRTAYTNVLRLARSVDREDQRPTLHHAITQVVFYQPGVGSDENLYSKYVEGQTGSSLGDKVEQAYAFIAHNYNPGDEIFLLGFSRGAYTARMVAQFIKEIGVLERDDMDSFGSIFSSYQKYGKAQSAEENKKLKAELAPWESPNAKGKKRVADSKFAIKFLGLWDTVGHLGLPQEIRGSETYDFFRFNDEKLGDHIEHACQALAMHETRDNFQCSKLHQTSEGRAKGQYVKQVWFTGCHSDVGGGYDEHDLADLTLNWMASELEPFLSIDLKYMRRISEPSAPWGQLLPHDPTQGLFTFQMESIRDFPTGQPNNITQEYIHESVLSHPACRSDIKKLVEKYPNLVCKLSAHETLVKDDWPYDKGARQAAMYEGRLSESRNVPRVPTAITNTINSLKRGFWKVAPMAAASGFTLLVASKVYN